MNPDILSNEIIRRKKRNKKRNVLLAATALLATLVTAYILLIPAFTQEKINLSLDCAADFHHHTEACYTESGELICGYADYVIHQHNDLCYDNGGSLICTLPESEEHIHSDSCYTQIKTLICTVGDENHIHDESCYKIENVLSCGKDELHTHTEECYDENSNLICGKLELKKHTHDAQCLKEVQEESSTEESVTEISAVPKLKTPLKAAAVAGSTTYVISNNETKNVNGGTISVSGTNQNGKNKLTCTVTSLVSGTDYQNVKNQINSSMSADSSLENLYVYQITEVKNAKDGKPTTITVTPDSGYEFYSGDVSTTSFIYTGTPIVALYTVRQDVSQESVVQESDSEISETNMELTASSSDYTVTVKGNQNKLKDCKVFVEKVNPEDNPSYYSAMVRDINSTLSTDVANKNEIFQFVAMYHIYLSKNNGTTEYVLNENDNVNLQVTITDSTLNDEQAYIGHYGNGAVKKAISDSNGLSVKQLKISHNSMTFHLKSFSVITAAALKESQQAGNSSNSWQIVSGDDLTIYEYKENVRIQKKVIPTGVENEFNIYLNVEPQIENKEETTFIKETFNASGFLICNNNNGRETDYIFDSTTSINDVINAFGLSANSGYSLLVDKNKSGSDYYTGGNKTRYVNTIIIEKSGGGTITLSNVNMKMVINGNPKSLIFCLKDSGKSYKCPDGISYDGTTLTFKSNVYENMITAGLFTPSGEVTTKYKTVLSVPTTVTDKMGDCIEYLGVQSISSGDVIRNGNTIIWNMGTAVKTDEETYDGKTYVKNAYELVYRIRLKTDKAGFIDGNHYLTNALTILAGTGITPNTSFTSPQVKGKLPNTSVIVNMIKTADGDVNSPISNAEFTLQCVDDGEYKNQYYKSDGVNTSLTATPDYQITSGSDGKFSVTVPNGTYILTETKTPDGYYTTDTWTLSIKNNLIDSFVVTSTNNAVEKNGEDYNISNKSGKVLPSTGGTGTNICITGGVLIIALTLLWGYIIGKKQKNS